MSIYQKGDPQLEEELNFGSSVERTIDISADAGYPLPCWLLFDTGARVRVDSLPFRIVRRCSTVQPTSGIARPVTPAAQATSDTQIKLTWTREDRADADFVSIERASAQGGPFSVLVASMDAAIGEYFDNGRTPDTEYFYRLMSRIDSGSVLTSEYSDIVSARTAPSTLTPPSNLTVTELSRTTNDVTYALGWGSVPGATGYRWRITDGGDSGFSDHPSGSPNEQAGTSTQIIVPRQILDDRSVLEVWAFNAGGDGPANTEEFFAPGNLKPPVLAPVTVATDDISIPYTENAEADAADHYSIERNSGAGFSEITTVSPGVASPQYTDVDRPVGSHIYRVRAVDVGPPLRESDYSAERTGNVSAPPPTGAILGANFRTSGGFPAGFSTGTPVNCYHVPSLGIERNWISAGGVCDDQSLTMTGNIGPTGRDALWLEYRHTYQSNWDTENLNCTASGNVPDYKHLRTYVNKGTNQYIGFKVGTNRTNITVYGSAGLSEALSGVPLSVMRTSTPINATTLWDGLEHVYRQYMTIEWENGVAKHTIIASIDGIVTHAFRCFADTALTTAMLFRDGCCLIGANRNLRVPVDTKTWAHEFYVFASNPGWFDNVTVKDWT